MEQANYSYDDWKREHPEFVDAQDEQKQLTPEEAKERAWMYALEALHVPARYMSVARDTKIPSQAEGWAGDPWAITLLGAAGTGKTWIAVKILAHLWGRAAQDGLIRRQLRPRFYDISVAIENIKAEYGTDEAGQTLGTMMNSKALVLDDLGAERETDFTKDQVSVVLRNRYNQMLPTIITSNASNLGELGDQRIASRLSDGIVITLSGKDRRGKR